MSMENTPPSTAEEPPRRKMERDELKLAFKGESLHPVELTEALDALENLDKPPQQQEADARKIAREQEAAMQAESDDFAVKFFQQQARFPEKPEEEKLNAVINGMFNDISTKEPGIEPGLASGRVMHAYTRFLEASQKDDADTKQKLAVMESQIKKIIDTAALGLGHEKVDTTPVAADPSFRGAVSGFKAAPSTASFESVPPAPKTKPKDPSSAGFRLTDLQ